MSNEIIILRGQRHVVWECGTCGVVSTCPEIVYEQHRMEGGYHTCPNGHRWGWEKDSCERERLRRERDRLKQNQARLEQDLADARAETARVEASKRRMERRIHSGTCPCCKRTFRNVAKHMATKHPNIATLKATA